jgi:hypothetical protein
MVFIQLFFSISGIIRMCMGSMVRNTMWILSKLQSAVEHLIWGILSMGRRMGRQLLQFLLFMGLWKLGILGKWDTD